jgi:hypothetical protein
VNGRLALARVFVPRREKKRKLRRLAALTERAFGAPASTDAGGSWRSRLHGYARLTRELAARVVDSPAAAETARSRLFAEALPFGRELRGELGVRSLAEAFVAARILYRALGIDLKADPSGTIVVRRCFFASFYGPRECRLMSALDAGILVGLAGGGTLEFDQRLSEGAGCCRARLSLPERP